MRLNHFTMTLKAAEYVNPAPDQARACGECEHVCEKPQWLRCDKGGFIVKRTGTCKHFAAKERVQIGPTDI